MTGVIDFLRDFPFFDNLDEESLGKIAKFILKRKYDKGTNIFLEEDQGDELYFIESGLVQIYRLNEAREIILSLLKEGDFFGEMAVLEDEQVRSASAKTVEKTTLYVLKRRDFDWLMSSNPDIAINILKTALTRLRRANELITDLTVHDARARIARGLLRLIEMHGVHTAEGILINMKLTHQQIADMTGTVRETVTKVMSDLQLQQIVAVEKKIILVIDLAKLKQLVDTV
ncbi:Crp/Fnr family transcriptional regulator [Paenibacillus sp. GCM10027626]|uniref:Crp/Fnr family transcriptional regulator n=1 Tax=Paenibacillus sp. GCM10027626 TaxID=3273411 RepID=UPI00363EAE7B